MTTKPRPLPEPEPEESEYILPVTPEIIETLEHARQKPERILTKKIVSRLERLAHAGEDVDLIIQIRKGKVRRTGHMPWYTYDDED